MQGAREYADLFSTCQYGRLYIVSGSHARGRTFHIFVLRAGECAIENGPNNAPLNSEAVEVYGETGGHRGWTETYGWLHHGKWEQDFSKLVEDRRAELAKQVGDAEESRLKAETANRQHQADLLETY